MIEKAPRQSMLENLSSVIQPEPCPLSGAKKMFHFCLWFGRNWSITKHATKKTMLKGKTNQTSDNSMTPAAKVGAMEPMSPSVKK